MAFKKWLAAMALSLPAFFLAAQSSKPPQDWFLLDPGQGNFQGTGAEEALKRLQAKKQKSQTIVVAVLDSGVDYKHEDLADVMWVNPGEIAGNGIDDDKNGYIDDIHGWNFIGGQDGGHVLYDTYEATREYVRLKKKYEGSNGANLSGNAKKEYEYWLTVKEDYEAKRKTAEERKKRAEDFFVKTEAAFELVTKTIGKKVIEQADLAKVNPGDNAELKAAVEQLQKAFARGVTQESLPDVKKDAMEQVSVEYDYRTNPDFDPRTTVGDNYGDLTNRSYGNNDVKGPDASHGTHVAGIIAAVRNNGKGINGIADNVRIMSVRCVPDGDERDKDVANAIRYAVDNGASIINMSFGKGFSPEKKYVDEAVRYAAAHDVLLVHAAGNDSENNDKSPNFPNDTYAKKGLFKPKTADTWMEIGALSWRSGENRTARFSNYGKENVDLFSPGEAIYSTIPENEYASFNGTSMAAPAAAGVAALIRSYYPELSAKQVKGILMNSVVKQDGEVYKPGTTEKVPFSELCVSGGIVSATKAVDTAAQIKGKKSKKARWQAAGAAQNSVKKPALP